MSPAYPLRTLRRGPSCGQKGGRFPINSDLNVTLGRAVVVYDIDIVGG
jgi:hypothetical protein